MYIKITGLVVCKILYLMAKTLSIDMYVALNTPCFHMRNTLGQISVQTLEKMKLELYKFYFVVHFQLIFSRSSGSFLNFDH